MVNPQITAIWKRVRVENNDREPVISNKFRDLRLAVHNDETDLLATLLSSLIG